MQSGAHDPVEDPPASRIPDDVAALYLWANLPDATYRDFSAGRRKLRAQRNQRATQAPPCSHESPSAFDRPEAPRSPQTEGKAQTEPHRSSCPGPELIAKSFFNQVETDLFPPEEPPTRYSSVEDPASYPALTRPSRYTEPTIPQPPILTAPPQPGFAPETPPMRWHSLNASRKVLRSPPHNPAPATVPILVVFAPTPGAGKTTLLATLGRALSRLGESVALAETGSQGSLAAHFAVKDLQPGTVRVISPHLGSPITLVRYHPGGSLSNPAQQTLLAEEFLSLGATAHRLLLDLTHADGPFLQRLVRPHLTVLVPVVPTMSSVISLQAIERFFRELAGPETSPLEPWYLIVQFDETLPVHRDVRDFLSRRVGERLLPSVIRSASIVPQAFAQGTTVVDYAPNSPVSADYKAVADWLRAVSPPAPPSPPPPPRHASRWTDE